MKILRQILILLLGALAIGVLYFAGHHTPPRCDHALFTEAAHNCQ